MRTNDKNYHNATKYRRVIQWERVVVVMRYLGHWTGILMSSFIFV